MKLKRFSVLKSHSYSDKYPPSVMIGVWFPAEKEKAIFRSLLSIWVYKNREIEDSKCYLKFALDRVNEEWSLLIRTHLGKNDFKSVRKQSQN